MEFVIVTGLSGAGKTNALHSMEDIGFYCVDNLPPALFETFYDLCENSADNRMQKVAVVADARSDDTVTALSGLISKLRFDGKSFKILYLDAKTDILLNRYKETRRKHPLIGRVSSASVNDAVLLEAKLMSSVRAMADYVVDTSYMKPNELKKRVATFFSTGIADSLVITCISFGFKYGIPPEADCVIDARCLPNPFYVKELKPLTGLDEAVRSYVMSFEESKTFVSKLIDYFDFAVPLYQQEGKSEFVIGVGCTGGKHRSVTVARMLNAHFSEKGYRSSIHHRDISKT